MSYRRITGDEGKVYDPVRPERPVPDWHGSCSYKTETGRCNEPGIAYVVAECSHGHMREGPVCRTHLRATNGAACLACAAAPRFPHDCALHIRELMHREA